MCLEEWYKRNGNWLIRTSYATEQHLIQIVTRCNKNKCVGFLFKPRKAV